VSLASLSPLSAINFGQIVPEGSAQPLSVHFNDVSPKYFETLGIPVLQGRTFTEQETETQAPVALVNEALARAYWPGEQAVGKRFKRGNAYYQVIGVVKNVRSLRLSEVDGPYYYEPIKTSDQTDLKLLVRAEANPRSLAGPLREAVREIDPHVLVSTSTLAEVVAEQIALPRAVALFAGAVGLLALLLASVGLYGVMSYAVSQRTHEIGIRMALGAKKGDVLRLVVRQGMLMALVGVAIGILASLALTRLMETLLYGVSVTDPLTFTVIALLLTSVALLACFVPARRAAKVDPLVALRYE
jgi:putative ABC transport system permease protein